MSERGIPYSYRDMHMFGSHTFSLINTKNESCWAKFHFHTQQGIKNLSDAESEVIIAKDRESHQRNLYDAIEHKDFPRRKLFIQVMPEKAAAKCPYNPFGAAPRTTSPRSSNRPSTGGRARRRSAKPQ